MILETLTLKDAKDKLKELIDAGNFAAADAIRRVVNNLYDEQANQTFSARGTYVFESAYQESEGETE